MTKKYWAGIGSRKTPSDIIWLMGAIAYFLAKAGEVCKTGAAKGADQAFARGANLGLGEVMLFLPWDGYEKEWISTEMRRAITRVLVPYTHKAAMDSVSQFHPTAGNLSQGVVKLHARNYLIVEGCRFVVCWTPNGGENGGTGQGIRIAKHLGIPIYNLGNPKTLRDFEDAVRDRLGELPNEL